MEDYLRLHPNHENLLTPTKGQGKKSMRTTQPQQMNRALEDKQDDASFNFYKLNLKKQSLQKSRLT